MRKLFLIPALLLLSGCFAIGKFVSTDCSTDPCSETKAALVELDAPGQAAFMAGAKTATESIREATKTRDERRAREQQLDQRIAEVVDYTNVARKLDQAMAAGIIIDPDKSAIQDIVLQRQAGALTDDQARDAMLPFITKYGL